MWVTSTDPPGWMADGSYLVARRIRILIETWDRSSLQDQEATIGRTRPSGAPLGGVAEHDADRPVGDRRQWRSGDPHRCTRSARQPERRQHPHPSPRLQLHRRSRSARTGNSMPACSSSPTSATRAPSSSRLQTTLAGRDALNEYIQPRRLRDLRRSARRHHGTWIGQTLFA